jgi:hypothetical protein
LNGNHQEARVRISVLVLALALTACAAPSLGGGERIMPADPATELIAGGPLTLRVATQGRAGEGQDPLVSLTLTRADGRVMRFTEANHTPYDVMAQAPGGPLAQVMGFFADEQPVLYRADAQRGSGAPFLCGPEGPQMLGLHRAADGAVTLVGLKSGFEFEPRADGTYEALPYSPDQVCARLRFRRA